MKLLNIQNDRIMPSDINEFGGNFSFMEKLLLKGIGSPKTIYAGGVKHFDKLNANLANEVAFVNFELLKNGLLLHYNNNQRFAAIAIKISELKSVNLVAYRIAINQRKFGSSQIKFVHRGELEIIDKSGSIRFSVLTKNFKGILNFFSKKPFNNSFHYSVSVNPPEKDYSHLLEIVNWV